MPHSHGYDFALPEAQESNPAIVRFFRSPMAQASARAGLRRGDRPYSQRRTRRLYARYAAPNLRSR